jgi:hypothetical protein
MNKFGRALIALVCLPFLAGCFAVMQVPVPRTAAEREAMNLRGVVVSDGTGEESIRFEELHEAAWTPSSLSIVADVNQDGTRQTITRLIPITTLSGLYVRQIDPGKTSGIIGGLIVGTVAVISVLITGRADEYQGGAR